MELKQWDSSVFWYKIIDYIYGFKIIQNCSRIDILFVCTIMILMFIPGLKIKLRPLSLGEVSDAEARVNHMSDVSPDVVHKIRSAIILSEAIIALNDSPIEKENTEIADIKIRRRSLYIKLMQMPTSIIMKIWEEYLSAVKEQESLLNAETTKEKLSDF